MASPSTLRAEALLQAEDLSATCEDVAPPSRILPDQTFSCMKAAVVKLLQQNVSLDDVETFSVKFKATLYDVDHLFVLGSSWKDLEANFGKMLMHLVQNTGTGPDGTASYDDLVGFLQGIIRDVWSTRSANDQLPPPNYLVPTLWLDRTAAIRVQRLTDAFRSNAQAVYLAEMVIMGLLHPPEYTIAPTETNDETLDEETLQEQQLLASDPEFADLVGMASNRRDANPVVNGMTLGSSGSGKSHVQTAVIEVARRVEWPAEISQNGKAPINRRNTNSSRLNEMASKTKKMGHFPDEGKKALHPCQPDPLSSGGGASASYKLNSAELLDFMTPIEGGCTGVKSDRTYNFPNAFLTTMQTSVVKYYFPEDETGACLYMRHCRGVFCCVPP